MSISVTQEEAKWQPVTIVIDDVRTANLLRFALQEFYTSTGIGEITNNVNGINDYVDSQHAMGEIKSLMESLQYL